MTCSFLFALDSKCKDALTNSSMFPYFIACGMWHTGILGEMGKSLHVSVFSFPQRNFIAVF